MAQTTERLPNGLLLHQDDRYFKLGQDSVLLSSFARPRRNARVLDLCCGTGTLALLLYRPDLRMTGLELQEGALALFRRSIRDNGVDITALQGDLREIRTLLPHGSMDYVVCNPPYFDRNAGKNAPAPERRAARQDGTCTVEDLAVACSFVLHTGACGRYWKRSPASVSSLNGSASYTRPRRPSPARCWSNAARAAARKAFRSNRRCLSKARNITKYTKNNFLREYYNE